MSYVNLSYQPEKDDLICLFKVEPEKGVSVKKAAEAIASESSIGTWTEVKTMKQRIRKLAAKVFEIDRNFIKVAYPSELFEPGNMPQILSSIAGNIFGIRLLKNLRLEDVLFPKKLLKDLKGPKFGIKGIRKLFKIYKRPLTGTIIKPKLGLNEKEHAKVAYDAWIGGIDIVKDDENLSSMLFNNFSKRVLETLKLRDKAERETGERKIYMPNITAEVDSMLERANFVKAAGGEYTMVDIITTGWSGLQTLRNANESLSLVLHAHRAGHAALTKNPKHGISMQVLAKITRVIGFDQLHVGTIVGKMFEKKREVLENCKVLREKMYKFKPVMPVASGGLHPGHIPELVKNFGINAIFQFGGGCHGHPLGTQAGAKAIRQALEATMEKIDLKEYAKKHKELKIILKKWVK